MIRSTCGRSPISVVRSLPTESKAIFTPTKVASEISHEEAIARLMVSRRVPFQAFELTADEQQHCQDRAYQLLDRTLRGYDERDGQGDGGPSVPRHHSDLDSSHWKLLKTQDDASMYMERNSSQQDPYLLGGNWKNPVVLLVVGTIRGDLDEIMLGVETPDFPALKARSETFINQPVDGAFLAKVLHPTKDDPFQCMAVQWTVYEHDWPLKAMVNPRDFVSLAWTGTMTRANGDRIGYELVQPANLSQCPPLPKPFVRGKVMYAAVFKQKEPGIVDVYVETYIETQGFLLDKLVVNVTWRGMLGFWKTPELAEVKKLQWCMANRRKQSPSVCGKCIEKRNLLRRRAESLSGRNKCELCQLPSCFECLVERTVQVDDGRHVKLKDKRFFVCEQCLAFARELRSIEIAGVKQSTQELERQDTIDSSTISAD